MISKNDVIIVGAGPVGLFAIFQCGMLKMNCAVIDSLDFVGGQCTALYPEKPIYDIPAFKSIDAQDLITNLEEQAAPFKPSYHLSQQVTKLEKVDNGWLVETSKGTKIEGKAVIIAAGCGAFGPNRPPLTDLEKYENTGCVSYMVQKREQYRGKKIVIAGGGDSAVDWALSLSEIADNLHIVHRRSKFRCAPESADRLKKLADEGKISLEVPFQLSDLSGEDGVLKEVILKDLDNNIKTIEADILLPFYGLSMELGPIANWGLNIDKKHIAIDPSTCATSIDGIFAIGDINSYKGKLKLISCGFSEAAMAAHAIYPLVHDEPLHFEYSTTKGTQ